jgi:hypothetical protein
LVVPLACQGCAACHDFFFHEWEKNLSDCAIAARTRHEHNSCISQEYLVVLLQKIGSLIQASSVYRLLVERRGLSFSSRILHVQTIVMMRPFLRNVLALLLALNFFAFQIELFDEEYEANHPDFDGSLVYTVSGITWESFDKENAPEAFVFDAGLHIEFLFLLHSPHLVLPTANPQFQPVRDKSPPSI